MQRKFFIQTSKKIIVLTVCIIFCLITNAQSLDWMKGTWNSTTATTSSAGTIINTIKIDDVSNEGFTGTKTSELNNGSHAKITISLTGAFRGRGMYLQNGDAISKEGNIQWPDCSSCAEASKIVLRKDTLVLVDSISDCGNSCDGITFYYRLLSDFDSTTQRRLADRFGRPSDIIAFQPFHPAEDKPVDTNSVAKNTTVETAADALKRRERIRQDSLDNIARLKQQQADNALLHAQEKKRQQDIADSLKIVQQKAQKRVRDSLNTVAKLEKIKAKSEDSLRAVQAKKRQQEISDSSHLAKQREQQRIKDSLDNVAKIKQQQINDAALLAQQKKREKQIQDSLNLAQEREQQRVTDSLDNAARLEEIKRKTEDSMQNVAIKKRQQEIADSLSLVKQQEQQRIHDSLQNVAINIQKQKTADSLSDVLAKKRQQEITDSLAAVEKQRYNDSLQQAALAKKVSPPANDTTHSAEDEALKSRNNVLLGSYHINTPDILIELFDNGEIDGDRVSVYHNNSIIVNNQMLNKNAITLNIHADTANRLHEFVLIAENLGSIPPNSALMRITVGKDIYKLSVNTDMKTNARIVFYYDGN